LVGNCDDFGWHFDLIKQKNAWRFKRACVSVQNGINSPAG
jgi:hypothetical protein